MYRFSYKYLLLALCMLSTLSLMGQNPQVILPADGDWPTVVGDSIMLIGPNQESLTEEQRYFNPPYLLVYPGKEHLKNDMIRAALCDCDPTQPNRRIGVFSVSGDKKVSFSQGNLQYLPAANIWKFADTQYEYLGNANKYLKPTFRNWVDLFGWSANNTTAPFGVSTSTNAADYAGDFVDWGMNEICGDAPNTWRTLSKDEWEYLINKRANAKQLRGVARVHDVNGLILLPDNWITPAGISFSSGMHAKDSSIYFAQVNDYTLEKWQLLEESGAVFLPAAGVIRIDEELRSESRASYWSSTGQGTKGYILNFHSSFIITSNEDRYGRRSVRLVHDTVLPEAVDLGLSVKWATFNVGAKAPEEFGYYFAWGETRPKDKYTWATYQWCEGTYSSLTKYCTNSHYGTVDNNATLDSEDDAATIHWKDNWRMPTNSEWAELYTNCTWTRITLNGVIGYKVTSKVAGYTDKSIFLPAAGYRTNASIGGDNNGYYWSSSLYTGDPNEAWRLYHSSSGRGRSHSINRHYGWSIRPVYGQPTCTVPTVETIPATQITDQSALVGGKVSDDGTGHIHEFGVVYSTLENPTITDNKIVGSDGMGLFVNTLADLQPHTTYYIRAYAINEHGVGYGTQESFTTGSIHPEDTTGMENGHAYVDLGLSVLWATCNIGADAPEQYGDYFAWGETQPKEKYNWSTYQWSNTDGSIITKYVTNSTYGTIDNKTLLDPTDDAAIVNWGGNWRMPTYTELTELRTQCIWVWTCENGIYGHRVTSPINGNSIFLPAAGYKSSKSISYLAFAGYYASSSLRPHLTKENFYIHFRTSYTSGNDMSRYIGLTIRPVLREHLVKTPTVTTYDATQITDTSALVSGRVTNDGGANITEHGVVFSTSKKPTIDHNKVVSHDGMSAFSCLLTQLMPNTTYYARAFATNSAGTAYGKQITIYTIDPSVSPPSGNANGYDYVDLGLSVMWATSNVGATTPQQPGDLVAWGETTTKTTFDWNTYLWYNMEDTVITKYCVSSKYGNVDNLVILDSIDDIAAHMGSKWHMPTDEEWEELRTRCTWYWSYQGGINGYKVVAPNGNSIFLPAAGYRIDTTTYDTDTIGYYWSSNLHLDFSTYARGVSFTNSYLNTFFNGRYCGQSIRPVHDTIVSQPEPKYVDLGLSVKWATFNIGASQPEDYGDYFAWGETEPKEEYSWATYKWCQGTANTLTKYCSNVQYGNVDYKTILDPEDDAAIVHWGSDWRMPTIDEWLELKQKCSWKKIIINGITGYQVTAENGNSIFLPRAGLRMSDILYANDSVGYYASSSHLPEFSHEDYASYMLMYDNSISKSSTVRYYGLSIRPVYDDRVTLTVIPTPADATVGFYYSEGFNVDSNSVKVKKGSSPLYQVAATKKGYLSQGDTLHHITQDTTLYIELRPFSKGTWVKVDTSEFTRVDSFFVSRHQGVFSGPYSSWSYFYAPVLPGETYRVRAHAGQHAALWYAASNAPDQAAGIRPTKVACSANGGIVRYIAEEFTIPEGANYLIINAANKGTNLIIERKVPDPCLVVKVNDTLSINLMCVEGGTFRMGVGADNYIERDDPQANKDSTTHLVTLSDYYMAETAVTQGLWQAVMGTDIHDMVAQSRYPDDTPKVGDRYPMGYVVLKDALAFVDELNKLTGLHFRLPTEAEREYAARGGKRSREYKYPGSNDYTKVASPYGTPVAQKLPNELGIYDLSGCTREMCTDSWRTTYIYDEHVVNPVGPIQNAGNRTMRGGHIHSQSHPFTRYPFTPTWCRNELGFRIILPTETQRRMIHVNGSFFEMCFVKGGTFMMGSDAPDAQADEQPVHEVTLSDYYIGQTEVTQHLWKAVMGDENNPSVTKGNNLPVTNISWDEAQAFVDRLSEMTGMHFRLPTEAEWEYAARGGQKSKGYTYAGSDDIDEVGWYAGNSGNKLHSIGEKSPNELGIFDMTGNAWEWCQDWYGAYSTEAQVNPTGPNFGSSRVLRSGSYTTTIERCTAKFRQARQVNYPDTHIGLRIVLDPNPKPTPVPPEPEYVDLSLSVKWATFNIGASQPEDYGDYFAWGETEPKEEYSWATYKWCQGTANTLTKYCSNGQYGNVDYKTILDPEDDAAIVHWGSDWRMPTIDEWLELKQNCSWKKILINGITGYQVTAKNGNSIFLPRAGLRMSDILYANDSVGYYASSSHLPEFSHEDYASYMLMYDNSISKSSTVRYYGLSIRPVYDDRPDPCLVVKVNDTLSINMMCVEGGTMYIGRGDTVNRPYRQRPLRQVTISDFYLGQTEVTQELWLAIMGENPTYFPCDTCLCHPVDSVSIDEVLLFIERLNTLTGYNFRLPTEAEWEYAARGGMQSKGYAYAGSDNRDEVAWYGVGDSRGGTPHPVAQKRPNELGLYDMHGNLWEFVHDKFVDDINIYPSVNPTGPEGMRGSATGCGSAYYSALMPENTWGWVGTGGGRSRWFGFRLALSDQDPFVPITIGKFRFHMMYVEGGTFMMGSDAPDAQADEQPVHEVSLSDYYIGQTEVTQHLWKIVMGSSNNPSATKGDELPVTNITWEEAQVFVQKLSEMTGLHFRLPTEAEWEYAARGGQNSHGYTYAGSNNADSVAWHIWNTTKLQAVGKLLPNELGIYDMTGNVWEYCSDFYSTYEASAQVNPQGPQSSHSGKHVTRGGGWRQNSGFDTSLGYCRVANRAELSPSDIVGLRIVLDPNPKPTPVPPEPEYVDLGLSVKWATFNMGATSPEDYGDYFAWGETEPKETYSWENYKWCDGTDANMTKYNATDGKTILEPEDDAAHVNWGGKWRMPTEEEFTELREKCTWTWTTQDGVKGYKITGPSGNSIFIPAAGFHYENGFNYGENGDYWSAEAGLPNNGIHLNFYPDKQIKSTSYRYFGFSIRPVYDDSN